jgi:hypothetical protein
MAKKAIFYITDFETVRLPDDFPSKAIRKDGWPDKRWGIAEAISKYFKDLSEASAQHYIAGTHRRRNAISWAEWLAKS